MKLQIILFLGILVCDAKIGKIKWEKFEKDVQHAVETFRMAYQRSTKEAPEKVSTKIETYEVDENSSNLLKDFDKDLKDLDVTIATMFDAISEGIATKEDQSEMMEIVKKVLLTEDERLEKDFGIEHSGNWYMRGNLKQDVDEAVNNEIAGNRNDIENSIATATKLIIARSGDYRVRFYCPSGSTFYAKSSDLKNMKKGQSSGPKKYCYGCWSRADGCSDPTGTVVSNSMFGGSCNIHDGCYSWKGRSKSRCDWEFLVNMYAQCYSSVGWATRWLCYKRAKLGYAAVVAAGVLGNKGYQNGQESNCKKT